MLNVEVDVVVKGDHHHLSYHMKAYTRHERNRVNTLKTLILSWYRNGSMCIRSSLNKYLDLLYLS